MQLTGKLETMQVGKPQQHLFNNPKTGVWESSFVRKPDPQPRWLYTTHLEGNAQADTKHHGSLDQAVLVYSNTHYPNWQAELERDDFGPGALAENFTVSNLAEETVYLGDIYEVGEAQIQVTGPRFPCWKIEQRWNISGLTARVAATGRTGWYCRVLQEGRIEPGLTIKLVERPYPQWSIALINDFGHRRNNDIELAQQLMACPMLSHFWYTLIDYRVIKQGQDD